MEMNMRDHLGGSRPIVLDDVVIDLVVRDVGQDRLEHRADDHGQNTPDLRALIAAQMSNLDTVLSRRHQDVAPCQRHDVQKCYDVCIGEEHE